MSYNNHVRDTVKPPPVVDIRSYPQMPYIPGKICTTHVTTPAAQRPEFSMPSFRGPNDPLPRLPVGVPHHSSAATYEHDDDDAAAGNDGNDDRYHHAHEPKTPTTPTTPTAKDRASSCVGRGPPPTSIRGPTVKHNAALPVRSPAANTFRGAPIMSRGTHSSHSNSNNRHVVMNRQSDRPPINFNSSRPAVN